MLRVLRWPGFVLSALVLAAGCTGGGGGGGGGEQLPDAGQLVSRAAQATKQIESVKFDLKVDGEVPGIAVSSAQGELTKAGNVKGTAVITATGQPAETEFVIVGDSLYLKGPTGGFVQLPVSIAASLYDPSKILDNNVGLGALVAGVTEAKVEGKENVAGVDCYRISGKFARNNLGVLLPGLPSNSDLPGQLWVAAAEPNRLVKAKVDVPSAASTATQAPTTTAAAATNTVTITLSEFNAPVTITPPS
jgi:lipoprotein LprG